MLFCFQGGLKKVQSTRKFPAAHQKCYMGHSVARHASRRAIRRFGGRQGKGTACAQMCTCFGLIVPLKLFHVLYHVNFLCCNILMKTSFVLACCLSFQLIFRICHVFKLMATKTHEFQENFQWGEVFFNPKNSVAYMQKAGDTCDISPQFFLDFPQNFRLRTRNQYCTQAIV